MHASLRAIIDLIKRATLAEPVPEIQPLSAAEAVHQAIADRTAPPKTVLDTTT